MKSLLVYRPINLVIIALLQFITYYFLNFDVSNRSLLDLNIWFVIIGSVLVSAAGYQFNDWIDVKTDLINKPNKIYITRWSKLTFWLSYILFNVLALMLFYAVNPMLVVWFSIVVILLILYSLVLKRLPLIGNFAVSLLAAFSVYVVYLHFQAQEKHLVIFFAGFAALVTYIRELIKDIEDVDGDRSSGYNTFPVLTGMAQSKSVVTLTTVFTLVIYSNLLWQWIIPQFSGSLKTVYIGYQALCVVIPLLLVVYLNVKANEKSDFTELSRLMKYVMATGMCSMLFF